MNDEDQTNASIIAAMAFFERIVAGRLNAFFSKQPFNEDVFDTDWLNNFTSSPLARLRRSFKLSNTDFILFLTALFPHADVDLVDRNILQWLTVGGNFPEIGGVRGNHHRGFIPTIQTFFFIIAGTDFAGRSASINLLTNDHPLIRNKIILIQPPNAGEPFSSSLILLAEEQVNSIFGIKIAIPDFSPSFPAKRLSTSFNWQDIILDTNTINGIEDIKPWLMYHQTLDFEDADEKENHGYKVLFYGPAGTGKTLAAKLLGKNFNKEVFSIDLLLLFSNDYATARKIIDCIFRLAEQKGWILFIDNLENFAGKSELPDVSSGNSNKQAVPYLLQQIEYFAGIVIFKTRSIQLIHEGFPCTLQSAVEFGLPGPAERLCIWNNHIPLKFNLDPTIDLNEIAETHAFSGAEISAIVKNACLNALNRHDNLLRKNYLFSAIERQYKTSGKTNATVRKATAAVQNEIKIFVCYSSKDRKLMNLLVSGLRGHLLGNEDIKYTFWDDRQIDLGDNWQAEIEKAMNDCQVAILLVSASFASSEFVRTKELTTFFKKNKEDGYVIVPVLIRSFNFQDIKELAALNFFKTYYTDYSFNDPSTRDKILPFDVLGDDDETSEKKLQDYYHNLSACIHTAVSKQFIKR